ncbi:KH domain-containing protein [Chamaesiphon sp. GL140_3_metabinner_50]|uniref:KH domain-containing protein n=1 Tax=Chamaesiphon sp. GL140_3_metabinner_50 TaxID=2970812 RepID=UPI0025F982BA|nr:KH domain-containing protein [Chamaesiphon sp. GL140_3_metabinner_50]
MTVSTPQTNLPDYGQLVKFLFQPFVSAADAIGVDCEYTIENRRVWIRVAIATADQGNAFGRGGRNVQAIRTILQTAATAVGQSVHLDVYGSNNSSSRHRDSDDGESSGNTSTPVENRPPVAKPVRANPNRRANGDGDSVPSPRPRR